MTIVNNTVLVDGDSGKLFKMDQVTNALIQVPYEHHEIHEGNRFVCSGVTGTLGDGDAHVLYIQTSSLYPHMVFCGHGHVESKINIREGVTATGSGYNVGSTWGMPIVNRNFSSSSVPTITITQSANLNNSGTLKYEEHFGAARNAGVLRSDAEFVLNAGTDYAIILVSEAAANQISWCIDWYEKTVGEG